MFCDWLRDKFLQFQPDCFGICAFLSHQVSLQSKMSHVSILISSFIYEPSPNQISLSSRSLITKGYQWLLRETQVILNPLLLTNTNVITRFSQCYPSMPYFLNSK